MRANFPKIELLTLLRLTTTMNAPVSAIEQLLLELPDLDWITDEGRVTRLSQDFSWFSPVLNRQLKDKRADVVVRPRSEDEIRAVVGACARRGVPIVIRGSGTGNYGQTTPLAGGVVLDMTGYNACLWVQPGVARAQAGIRLGELESRRSPRDRRCAACRPPTAARRWAASSAAASAAWDRSTTGRSARPATCSASAR
jgi:FAD/FMN-containing dehydrogenase